MPFEKIAETRIREALERGEFENLRGAGEPLSLEEYFATPEDLRMAFSILRNANCVPPEVELLKEVAHLEHDASIVCDDEARRAIEKKLNARRTELAVLIERGRRR
jgi:DnaJ-like protein